MTKKEKERDRRRKGGGGGGGKGRWKETVEEEVVAEVEEKWEIVV